MRSGKKCAGNRTENDWQIRNKWKLIRRDGTISNGWMRICVEENATRLEGASALTESSIKKTTAKQPKPIATATTNRKESKDPEGTKGGNQRIKTDGTRKKQIKPECKFYVVDRLYKFRNRSNSSTNCNVIITLIDP